MSLFNSHILSNNLVFNSQSPGDAEKQPLLCQNRESYGGAPCGKYVCGPKSRHVLFLPSQNIFFLTPLITNKTRLELKNIKKFAFTHSLKVKSDVKILHGRRSCGPVIYGCAAIESVSPQPSLICHINKRKPDSNCLIWRLYVEESRDNRLGSWRWQPAVLMWCGTSVSLSSIFDVPTAIRATRRLLGRINNKWKMFLKTGMLHVCPHCIQHVTEMEEQWLNITMYLYYLYNTPGKIKNQISTDFYSNKRNLQKQLRSCLRRLELLIGTPNQDSFADKYSFSWKSSAAICACLVLWQEDLSGAHLHQPSPPHFSLWPHSVIFIFLLPHSGFFYKVSPCITHLTMH